MSISGLPEVKKQILHVLNRFDDTANGLSHLSSSLRTWIAELSSQGADADFCRQLQNHRAEVEVTNAVFIESGNANLLPEELHDVHEAIDAIRAAL